MKKMKSLISALLCLAMILAMVPGVFAVEGDVFVLVTDVTDLASGDQVIIVSVDEDYALGTNQKSNNRAGTAVVKADGQVTATADVQVLTLEDGAVDGTFAFSTGEGYLYAASSSKNYLRTEETLTENSSWSISITDGVASVIAQGENTRATLQYNPNNGVPLFACYAGATQGAVAIYKLNEETGDDDTPANPLALGSNTLVSGLEYTYVVPADGRLELDVETVKDSAGSTIYSYAYNQGTRVQVLVDGEVITLDATRRNVTAGQKITVQVVSVDGDSYTVSLKLTEVAVAEVLTLGENTVAQDLEYVYTAQQEGTLYISMVELLYNGQQSAESALGSSVLYKINGASVSSFEKSYEVQVGDEIAVVIQDYSWNGSGQVSAVINLSYEGFYEHPAGSLANPAQLLYADCPTQTIEIAAGTAVWYELESYYDASAWSTVYPFKDQNLIVTGENAYVIVGSTRYDAVDGVVTVLMGSTTLIQIGNDGGEAAVFDIRVSIPEGHKDNPQDLLEGDNVITLGSYKSHYFDFVATESGTVTITISGDNWRVYYYYYDVDGNELDQEDRYFKNGDDGTFVVEIKAGESIVLNLGTSQGWSQPGGQLTVNVQFVPDGSDEPEILMGDVNHDGKIDYLDAMMIAQFYVGDIEEDALNLAAADVNGDGDVDYLDAMRVAQFYVGDIDSFA